ncbi:MULTISPECIES: phosphoribosylglycinamide formyltransferase [Sulfurimonas]|uniref:phosphoribosylglycinamide formyltransferase n=1 Tax=Sulfurimonas TaxID=202746 RepID=UPI0031B63795
MNLAVFASHNGSALDVIYTAIEKGELQFNLKLVISNNSDAKVLKKAKNYNIKHTVINAKLFESPDLVIFELLKRENIACVFLAGYMKKLSLLITRNFKVINSHPALLPKFGGNGMYGRFVHEAVIKNKEKVSGVTIHEVNENYDEGKIILQKSLEIHPNETVEKLEERIKELEKSTILEGLQQCLN